MNALRDAQIRLSGATAEVHAAQLCYGRDSLQEIHALTLLKVAIAESQVQIETEIELRKLEREPA